MYENLSNFKTDEVRKRKMKITITVDVPDDLQDPEHMGRDLTSETYD
jgi:hypothetical protein